MEKLDNFSKILIATGQINYMAASLNGANEQMKMVISRDRATFSETLTQHTDEVLQETVQSLKAVLERLGNHINNIDCICKIDIRVSKVPMEILIEGKDETEMEYDADSDMAEALHSLRLSVMAHPDYTGEENDEWTDLCETAKEALDKYNS